MCGGSKTVNNTTTSASQTDLPAWAKPYFERNIARAEAEFGKPYDPYSGERLAGTDPNVVQSREMVEGIVGSGIPGLGAAQDYATAGMDRANELGNYNADNYSQFGYSDPATFTGANVSQYMSPYQQLVTDQQKESAVTDFNRLQGARDTKAVQAGAFGGSRQAVQQGLAEEQLLGQLADIQAKGSQSAFADASKQFGADRAAQMTAEQRRAAELGRVQTGSEASDQFGAGQGLAALRTGAGMGTELSRLGQLERQTDIQDTQMLESVGLDRQAEDQAGLDLGYTNFLEQQGYTREQIGNMTGILSGMPIAATGTMTGTQTTPTQQPGAFQQAVGTGLSGLSLYKAFG
tara:strand:+ start:1542 stop:2585 length:1044 start_codon:yes stop_codon:yes gene_type:complete